MAQFNVNAARLDPYKSFNRERVAKKGAGALDALGVDRSRL